MPAAVGLAMPVTVKWSIAPGLTVTTLDAGVGVSEPEDPIMVVVPVTVRVTLLNVAKPETALVPVPLITRPVFGVTVTASVSVRSGCRTGR